MNDDMKLINGMWFPKDDTHFGYQLSLNPLVKGKGTYQFRKYRAALDRLPVKQRGHAVDIGSHIGLWARLMAHNFETVTCFEPVPIHQECWYKNMADHTNATLHPVALSNGEDVSIFTPADHTGHSHVSCEEFKHAPESQEVRTCRLDEFGLRGIDFMKIDVEGFELPVILGGEKTIRRERPMIVIEQKPNGDAERYGRERFAALDQLKAWGAKVLWEVGGDFCLKWD